MYVFYVNHPNLKLFVTEWLRIRHGIAAANPLRGCWNHEITKDAFPNQITNSWLLERIGKYQTPTVGRAGRMNFTLLDCTLKPGFDLIPARARNKMIGNAVPCHVAEQVTKPGFTAF